jgi:hypothetical protein
VTCYDVSISEKKVCVTMKPTSKSISALLKLEFTKTSKFQGKEKILYFFPPCVNPQHANIPLHKPSILINF